MNKSPTMSLYHISVKAEPDWAIGSSSVDQTESRNSIDDSAHASDQRIKKGNENSSNVDIKQAAAESSSNEPVAAEVSGEPLRVATPGYHRRSNWYAKERSSNFSKQECQLLRGIINKYSEILFNKKTDTATNSKKKAIWVKIEAEFNAVSSNKRTLKQLQAKLDNMKRNIRKKERSEANSLSKVVVIIPTNNDSESRISMNTTANDCVSLNTTASDCVSLNMTANYCVSPDGFVDVDEQAFNVMEVQVAEAIEPFAQEPHSTAAVIDPIAVECSEIPLVQSIPSSLPRTRVSQAARHTASRPRFRKRAKPAHTEYERNQKLRQTKLEGIRCTREYDRILFETKLQHLQKKRGEDRDIYELKKRKLELEISLLEKQNKN